MNRPDKLLVIGAAGFIGFHVAERLLRDGLDIVGLDNLNDYYDVALKAGRLAHLTTFPNFRFVRLDLADRAGMARLFADGQFACVIHLAAQAGVRYSLENPAAFVDSNLVGFAEVLEGCRRNGCEHLLYASSSSVYGANTTLPFAADQNVDHPLNLYAATKKANELMAHTDAHLYRLPPTGLRFFTVYGPWGRPDMAMWIFADRILRGEPISLFNQGQMRRDFTFVSDVVEAVVRLTGRSAKPDPAWSGERPAPNSSNAPWRPALQALGHEVSLFVSFDRGAYRDFADLNRRLIETVVAVRPDLLFCVLMHYEVWSETLDLIRSATPAALLNWGTDDSCKFRQFSRFIAPHFDLCATTDAAAFQAAQDLRLEMVVRSQWAAPANRRADPVPSAACLYDVSFVGAAYGDRKRWIAALRAHRVAVACFGHGWESGAIESDDVQRVYRQSRISLNLSDSGLQLKGRRLVRSRQIKARTFEVPMAGGFLLTQPAVSLGDYSEDGREIATFADQAALIERIRNYLAHPAERDAAASTGARRAHAEHSYEARFAPLLSQAIDRALRRGAREWRLHPAMIEPAAARDRAHSIARGFARLASGLASLAFGRHRGPRAARRVFYEISWRLSGARTYSAAGLPGRIFYRES
jgi:nucleoside-diphosphate-sugar epimerase/spore maturation protein CgeB